MFTLIRGVIIVGLIFYFSPVRKPGEPEPKGHGAEPAPAGSVLLRPTESGLAGDHLWSRVAGSFAEEVVRTAVNEKVQEAGLRLRDHSPWPPEPPVKPALAGSARSPDRDAAGRTSLSQAVRCIYRCDSTE